ncbi:MAG: NAD(P)-dependent oxidoreductase [Halobacteriaceae archaeon]
MTAVGLVGLGTMGKKFTDRLVESDHSLVAFDIDGDALAYATERGAEAADSPADVARRAAVVLLSLPSNEAVEAAMESADGVLEGAGEGTVVVDTGTTRPALSERYRRECEAVGADFLEAPLTRAMGVTMMVGGDPDTYERVSDVLDAVAGQHRRIGDVGAGQSLKLMKQIIGAGYDAACAEAVEFGRDVGVDPRLLNDYLEMGVNERFFEDGGTFEEGGTGSLALRSKDLYCAVDYAHENRTAVPLTKLVAEAHKRADRASADPQHHEGIVRYWRELNR